MWCHINIKCEIRKLEWNVQMNNLLEEKRN